MPCATAPSLSVDDLVQANVNPATGLATDYLNVFNEAVMLIELVADMPEMLDELAAWRPATYAAHFENSDFQGKDVVLAAYAACAPEVRGAFDAAADALISAAEQARAELMGAASEGARDVAERAGARVGILREHIAALDALIHGRGASPQDAVDALFA